jgi:hypothetical protein
MIVGMIAGAIAGLTVGLLWEGRAPNAGGTAVAGLLGALAGSLILRATGLTEGMAAAGGIYAAGVVLGHGAAGLAGGIAAAMLAKLLGGPTDPDSQA